MEAIIQVMEAVMGARDPYTVGHQQRVTRLACAMAEKMDLPWERLCMLHTAAALHDLGKIAIPSGILAKPGKLSAIEFAMIKSHPQAGYDILKPWNFPAEIGLIILQHHERLNGSGYPQGLKGKKILLEAQILSVADVVEAMCSHRPYRPARGLARALEEISQSKGILYDAAVVDSCVKLCESTRDTEELFTAATPAPTLQMLYGQAQATARERGNLQKRRPRRIRAGRFSWSDLPSKQFRFLLHASVASFLGAVIMVGKNII
jgi:HD-GYP domain-containing protein (c-di-GMP phosphodiesterase class II)